MVITSMPQCLKCRHYHKGEARMGLTCEAFPEGIPDEILDGDRDHRKPFKGDNGIRFEQIEGAENV